MENICIYHKNCADGFGAALAVKVFLDMSNTECEFIAAQYGDEPPCVKGKNVYIVDFSYSRELLIKMNDDAQSMVVLDHHKTAQANLEGLDFCHFDMSKSGAMMAWEMFGNSTMTPDLMRYIQDRDLWQWKMPSSKEYSAALQMKPMKFDVWEEYLSNWSTSKLIEEGKAVLEYQETQVRRALDKDIEIIDIAGYKVPCINTTHLISEIGNELAKGHPFAAMYFETDTKRIYSLRSASDGADVSKIAGLFGGGGHYHAAGFSVERPKHTFPTV